MQRSAVLYFEFYQAGRVFLMLPVLVMLGLLRLPVLRLLCSSCCKACLLAMACVAF